MLYSIPVLLDTTQILFDDLLGHDYKEPVFVKPNEISSATPTKKNVVAKKRKTDEAQRKRKTRLRRLPLAQKNNQQEDVCPIRITRSTRKL